jgi:hypothetical protein
LKRLAMIPKCRPAAESSPVTGSGRSFPESLFGEFSAAVLGVELAM